MVKNQKVSPMEASRGQSNTEQMRLATLKYRIGTEVHLTEYAEASVKANLKQPSVLNENLKPFYNKSDELIRMMSSKKYLDNDEVKSIHIKKETSNLETKSKDSKNIEMVRVKRGRGGLFCCNFKGETKESSIFRANIRNP